MPRSNELDFTESAFRTDYEQPADQAGFEDRLLAAYEAEFPRDANLLQDALDSLTQLAGSDDQRAADIILQQPFRIPLQDIAELPVVARKKALIYSEGKVVEEDMPRHVHVMLEGLYQLTGAKAVRDDREQGELQGMTLRLGEYDNEDIYFQEQYRLDPTSDWGDRNISVRILSPTAGLAAFNELTNSERDEFMRATKIVGLGAIKAHDINRQNYQSIVDLFTSVDAILSAAEIEEPDKLQRFASAAKSILRKFV